MKKVIITLIGRLLNTLAVVAPVYAGKKGFALFCTPSSPKLKPYQRQFLDTAAQESFMLAGHVIQTYRWGTGPVKILFVHGWKSHTFRWKSYIEQFPKDMFTLYALDAPAHGLSGGKYTTLPRYSTAIEMLIERTGPIDTVVAHSFGGFAMLHSLYFHPALPVRSLVLMGVPGEVGDFIKSMQDLLHLSPRTMNRILYEFEKSTGHLPGFFSAAKFAQALTLRGLIIHDDHDTDAPYRHAVEVHKAWKSSKLITTTGIGHNLKSPEVLRWVGDFAGLKEVAHDRA